MFCLLFVIMSFFLLKLFALQNRLRKGWFLSLLVCVFYLFVSTQNHSGNGPQLPLVQGLTSLSY